MQNNHSAIVNSSSPTTNHPKKSFCKLPKSINNHPLKLVTKLPKSRSSDQSWLITHQQFVTYGRNAKEWLRKCQLLLPQIERQQIWRRKRFKDIYEYAAKLAGMNRDQVNEALRVLHHISDKPALMKLFEEKGLQRVRPIAAIATLENQAFLAEKGRIMSKHTLEVYLQNYRREFLPGEAAQSANLQSLPLDQESAGQLTENVKLPSEHSKQYILHLDMDSQPAPKITIVMQLDPEIADQLQKIKGQSDWNTTIGALLKLRREKLEQEKPATIIVKHKQSQPAESNTTITSNNSQKKATHATKMIGSRTIPVAIKSHALAKTNSTCAFPGCQKPYKILHHTDRFAMFHTHDPDHIVPLCEAHERLAHLGLIENEDLETKYWKLRSQPDYDDPKYEVDMIVEKYRAKP
ncbi:hypothetical protein HZA40_04390 [Candidatus Peregrinibacteria bacterium]|nr:hypothetical protein [Candidatus Peregrinibacteria bacterium]